MSGFAKSLAPGFAGMEKEAQKSGESAGKGFGSKFAIAGVVAGVAAGAAIGAAVAGAVGTAMENARSNDKLAAQLGLNPQEAASAGKVAGSLYAGAYGESIDEVNGAVGAVMSSIKGMRTASEADVEAMTAKVLDLSSAFEIDAGRAAQVAGQLITSGLAVDGVAAADLLTASLQKVPAAVREDILDAADEYGPFFANLGYSGEEAMGLLVESSEKGMYGIDKTGDALKEFGIRATDLSKTSGDAYETIGLDQIEMSNAILAGGDVAATAFEKIVGGIQGIEDPAARAEAAIGLFGTPLEDLSVSEIPKFLDSLVSAESGLGDVGGAAEAMGKTLNDNASTNLESFKRQISTTFVDFIGGKALPAVESFASFLATNLSPAVDGLKGGFEAFGRWFSENIEVIRNVGVVIGVVLLPALVRLGVAATVSAAKQVLAWTMSGAGAIRAGVVYVAQSALMVGKWVWMGAQSLIQAARMAAAWLIAMGPIGWITAAVIAIAALVIANWDKISAWTSKVWGAIVSWVTGAWSNIKTAVSLAINWVVAWVTSRMELMKLGWQIIWNTIKAFVANTWSNIKTAVYNAIIWLGNIVLSTMEKIKTGWSNAWNWVKATVSNIWEGIKTVVRTVLDWILSFVMGGLDLIKTAWSNAWNAVKTTVTTIWDGIKSVVSRAWDGLKSTLNKLIDFVKTKPGEAFDAAKEAIGKAWDAIKAKVKDPIRAVVGFVNEGLIRKFNVIPGVNIPELKLPPGFQSGGYTGDGRADEFAGHVHKGEYVFTKAQTAALGKERLAQMASAAVRGGAASAGEGNMGGFFEGNAANIRRAGAYYLDVAGGMGGWNFGSAARMWDGSAGVKVAVGRGNLQGSVRPLERGGGILGYTTGNNIDMSPSWMARLGPRQRTTVAAHEIGHALGLPHNSMNSIMQPNLQNMAASPTALDVRNLQRLYPGGSGKAGDGSVENPFDGLIDAMVAKLKQAFPGGGMFIDAAGGLAKSGIEQVTKMVTDIKNGISKLAGDVFGKVKDFFGGGAATAPTLYDNGGVLSPNGGRPQLVQNKTGKPEYIFTNREMRALTEGRGGAGVVINGNVGWMPDRVAVEIETRRRRAQTMAGMDGVVFA